MRAAWAVSLSRVLAGLVVVSLSNPASAYTVPIKDCTQLLAGSDLIVIGRPTGATRDTGEGPINDDAAENPFVWVETPIQVIRVLQGQMSGRTLILHHLGVPTLPPLPDGRVRVWLAGPPLVRFDPSNRRNPTEWVFFLRREPDGRYAPYPNQLYAGAWSVYAVGPPGWPYTARTVCQQGLP